MEKARRASRAASRTRQDVGRDRVGERVEPEAPEVPPEVELAEAHRARGRGQLVGGDPPVVEGLELVAVLAAEVGLEDRLAGVGEAGPEEPQAEHQVGAVEQHAGVAGLEERRGTRRRPGPGGRRCAGRPARAPPSRRPGRRRPGRPPADRPRCPAGDAAPGRPGRAAAEVGSAGSTTRGAPSVRAAWASASGMRVPGADPEGGEGGGEHGPATVHRGRSAGQPAPCGGGTGSVVSRASRGVFGAVLTSAHRRHRVPAMNLSAMLTSVALAAAPHAGGGEANLQLPDLALERFLGGAISGWALLALGFIVSGAGLVFGLSHLDPAEEPAGPPVDARGLRADLRDGEDLPRHPVQVHRHPLGLHRGHHRRLLRRALRGLRAGQGGHHPALQPDRHRRLVRRGLVRHPGEHLREQPHRLRQPPRQALPHLRHPAPGRHVDRHDAHQRRADHHALHPPLHGRRSPAPASSASPSASRWAPPRCASPAASSPRSPTSAPTS